MTNDEKLNAEFNTILEKIAGMTVYGRSISSMDIRTEIVAAYLLGKTEAIITIKTAIEDELYRIIFNTTPKK